MIMMDHPHLLMTNNEAERALRHGVCCAGLAMEHEPSKVLIFRYFFECYRNMMNTSTMSAAKWESGVIIVKLAFFRPHYKPGME